MKPKLDLSGLSVDDVLELKSKKKKKVDGGKKGKRAERDLVKLFTTRFGDGFSRSVGSGNRWGQVKNLPKHAKDTLTGDLCCPKGFKWVLESKNGYDDIDLNLVLLKESGTLNAFLKQVTDDVARAERKPMLLWKKTRRPWLAFVHSDELEGRHFKFKFIYGKWTAVALEHLLELEDGFFFTEEAIGEVAVNAGKIDEPPIPDQSNWPLPHH
jgi:Holliday junction resolvase